MRVNSPPSAKLGLLLGYCTDKVQEVLLVAAGFKKVWRLGRDSENFASVEGYARRRPYTLGVATDLRILCGKNEKRADVVAAISALERKHVTIRDVRFPDKTHAELQEAATKIAGKSRFNKNHKKARYEGGKGGRAKGIAAAAARAAADPNGLIQKIVDHKEVAWRIKGELLKGVCSISTAKRLYVGKI